jgi:hypothetical protein
MCLEAKSRALRRRSNGIARAGHDAKVYTAVAISIRSCTGEANSLFETHKPRGRIWKE